MRKPIPATWFLASPSGFACVDNRGSVWASMKRLLVGQFVEALRASVMLVGPSFLGY